MGCRCKIWKRQCRACLAALSSFRKRYLLSKRSTSAFISRDINSPAWAPHWLGNEVCVPGSGCPPSPWGSAATSALVLLSMTRRSDSQRYACPAGFSTDSQKCPEALIKTKPWSCCVCAAPGPCYKAASSPENSKTTGPSWARLAEATCLLLSFPSRGEEGGQL